MRLHTSIILVIAVLLNPVAQANPGTVRRRRLEDKNNGGSTCTPQEKKRGKRNCGGGTSSSGGSGGDDTTVTTNANANTLNVNDNVPNTRTRSRASAYPPPQPIQQQPHQQFRHQGRGRAQALPPRPRPIRDSNQRYGSNPNRLKKQYRPTKADYKGQNTLGVGAVTARNNRNFRDEKKRARKKKFGTKVHNQDKLAYDKKFNVYPQLRKQRQQDEKATRKWLQEDAKMKQKYMERDNEMNPARYDNSLGANQIRRDDKQNLNDIQKREKERQRKRNDKDYMNSLGRDEMLKMEEQERADEKQKREIQTRQKLDQRTLEMMEDAKGTIQKIVKEELKADLDAAILGIEREYYSKDLYSMQKNYNAEQYKLARNTPDADTNYKMGNVPARTAFGDTSPEWQNYQNNLQTFNQNKMNQRQDERVKAASSGELYEIKYENYGDYGQDYPNMNGNTRK